jgi:ABC-2 type transport system ATP-binding protein
MPLSLEVSSLELSPVFRGVSFGVAPGAVHGVLGPRWAGKTALLRVLAGELPASSGELRAGGRVVLVAEDEGGSPIEERLDPATRRRVALARAIAGGPDVLLIDAPADRLDAETTRSLVARFVAQGGAVVWATRRLDDLLGLAGDVTLLAHGRVRYEGSADALAARALPGEGSRLRHAA